ncbi:MAG: VOC family protein [Gemmatimonadaceae bacterium]
MSNNENSSASSENGFKALELQASFTVKDLQKSLTFYQDLVGFSIDQKFERDGVLRAVALRAGGVRILLNPDDGAKGWDRVKGAGMGLMFITAQNVDDVANRIKAHGGTLASEPADMPWGARVFQVVDPDGFKFTISSERKAPAA